jgi:hypothetical protein
MIGKKSPPIRRGELRTGGKSLLSRPFSGLLIEPNTLVTGKFRRSRKIPTQICWTDCNPLCDSCRNVRVPKGEPQRVRLRQLTSMVSNKGYTEGAVSFIFWYSHEGLEKPSLCATCEEHRGFHQGSNEK